MKILIVLYDILQKIIHLLHLFLIMQYVKQLTSYLFSHILVEKGRVPGTKELVIKSTYILIYIIHNNCITITSIIHGTQEYPSKK